MSSIEELSNARAVIGGGGRSPRHARQLNQSMIIIVVDAAIKLFGMVNKAEKKRASVLSPISQKTFVIHLVHRGCHPLIDW